MTRVIPLGRLRGRLGVLRLWRGELGDDEVRENYMDSKFGGEDADVVGCVTA